MDHPAERRGRIRRRRTDRGAAHLHQPHEAGGPVQPQGRAARSLDRPDRRRRCGGCESRGSLGGRGAFRCRGTAGRLLPRNGPRVRRRSLRRRAARRTLPPGRTPPRAHRGHRPPQPAPLRRFARPRGLPSDGRPTIRHHRPRPGKGRIPGRNRRRHPRHASLRTRHVECAGNFPPRTRRPSGGAGRGLRLQTRLSAVRPSHPDPRSVEIAPYRPRILHRNAVRRLRRRIGHRALRRNRPAAFAPRHGDPRRKAVAGFRRSRRAAGRRPVSGFMSPGSTPENAGC